MGFKLPNGRDLSVEQLDIINLPPTSDWLISGAPGTGKTVMAIYRAGQVGQMYKDRSVLMLVYNRPLREYLASAVQGNYYRNVLIQTYHQWLYDLYHERKWGSVPKIGDKLDWTAITRQVSKLGKRYSHIIVDEAQDFPVELLQILRHVAEHMTCFIDPNQAIEPGKTGTYDALRTMCTEAPYTLTRNFRNTQPIRDLSALYCKDGEPAPTDMPGRKPVMIKFGGDYNKQNALMANIINRNKEKNVGIIVHHKALKRTFEAMDAILDDVSVQMYKSNTNYDIDFDQTGVKILSYGTMKGLEFDIVLLPLFDKLPLTEDKTVNMNRVYVAITRACEELYMFYWKESPTADKVDTMSPITANRDLVDWR